MTHADRQMVSDARADPGVVDGEAPEQEHGNRSGSRPDSDAPALCRDHGSA
jgi:hypothetical protein